MALEKRVCIVQSMVMRLVIVATSVSPWTRFTSVANFILTAIWMHMEKLGRGTANVHLVNPP